MTYMYMSFYRTIPHWVIKNRYERQRKKSGTTKMKRAKKRRNSRTRFGIHHSWLEGRSIMIFCGRYTLVIQHSHGTWPIDRWFSQLETTISRGFSMAMLNSQMVMFVSCVHSRKLTHWAKSTLMDYSKDIRAFLRCFGILILPRQHPAFQKSECVVSRPLVQFNLTLNINRHDNSMNTQGRLFA